MKKSMDQISSICEGTDRILWQVYKRSMNNQSGSESEHLRFPFDRENNIRVSEQEARFAFVEALIETPVLYSVETPTTKVYQFTGKKEISAMTDLTVYNKHMDQICRVEFKAKGFSTKRKELLAVGKDFQKLLREPSDGLWFHILKSVDNSTINKILSVMAEQIFAVKSNFKDVDSPKLTIHICTLKHNFSIEKEIKVQDFENIEELQKCLRIEILVTREKLKEIINPNGWRFH